MDQNDFYEQIIHPIEEKMVRTVWRITRNLDDAHDAFQQAVETILSRIDRIVHHANAQALVLKICIDEAYNVLRKKRPDRLVFVDSYNPNRPASSENAKQRVIDRETEEEILIAIGNLPPSQSTAVFMRFVLDEAYSHIAQALDCDEATARKHVSLGRSKLAAALQHLIHEINMVRS